jgi:hypothetical protein
LGAIGARLGDNSFANPADGLALEVAKKVLHNHEEAGFTEGYPSRPRPRYVQLNSCFWLNVVV